MDRSLSIIFAGTPEFAVPTLKAILDNSSHNVCAVLAQPDRPVGRGRKIEFGPVKQLAISRNLTIFQPKTLKDEELQKELTELKPDLMIVVAYGLIIPKAILSIPSGGCINVHGSLLPRWRGAAPIQYAIMNGDPITGITIMQMDEGLDTGPMLIKKSYKINSTDTSYDVQKELSILGSELLLETLDAYVNNKLNPENQNEELATYAGKLSKSQAKLDWTKPAIELHNMVRAFNPWPVAYCEVGNKTLRILKTEVLDENNSNPGEIIRATSKGIDVGTKKRYFKIISLSVSW